MTSINFQTEIFFGKDVITNDLANYLTQNKYHKILVLAGHSIHKNELWTDLQVISSKYSEIEFFLFDEITANPVVTLVNEAIQIGIKNKVDCVIGAGGGSSMDSAKAVALVLANQEKSLDVKTVYSLKEKNKALPIITIPTTAGTGSEVNSMAVFDFVYENHKTLKLAFDGSKYTIPQACFENSKYITTASNWQLACGIFDCFVHECESFCGTNSFTWTQNYVLGNLKTIYHYSLPFLKDHQNQTAADNIMWTTTATSLPWDHFLSNGDWNLHWMAHSLSAKWNITHGATLAILMPSYIKIRSMQDENYRQKMLIVAQEIFHVSSIDLFIQNLLIWINELKLVLHWKDFAQIKEDITQDTFEELYDECLKADLKNRSVKINKTTFMQILNNVENENSVTQNKQPN